MSEIGLVLGGGGAKGAYEIGAWKAICEAGLNKYISVYSGTSIGAINCALIQTMDFEDSAKLWLNNNLGKVFMTDGIGILDIIKTIKQIRNGKKSEFNGLFSRAGLINLMNKAEIEKLERKVLDFYVTVANITEIPLEERIIKSAMNWYNGKKTGFTQYIHLNNEDKEFVKEVLLATSAIPIIYPPVVIGDQYYVDGGINDNLPIMPVYKRGFKKIIAVSCERVNYNHIKRKFPLCEILLIQPSRYLGNLFGGTFNFDQKKIKYSYRLGYYDAVKALNRNSFIIYNS